jgi:hypothetical protein
MSFRRGVVLFSAVMAVTSLRATAFAQDDRSRESASSPAGRPPVSLALATCLDVPPEEVRRIVGIELRALLVDEREATNDTTVVVVDCHNPYAVIDVTDPITGKTLKRTVDLTESARIARPRLLALSIVELVSASWTEIESNPPPRTPVVGRVASPDARRSALSSVQARTPRRAMFRVVPIASIRSFRLQLWTFGGGLRVGADGARPFGWEIDAVLDHGTRSTPLGNATFDTGSGSASVVLRVPVDPVTLRFRSGLRLGNAWLSATPASPGVVAYSLHGLFWGPVVAFSATVAPARAFTLEATIEAGQIVSPVSGIVEGSSDVALRGIWLGASLGVGLAL